MTVKKYRKKPVVIEAMRLSKDNARDACDWIRSQIVRGEANVSTRGTAFTDSGEVLIDTLEGEMTASIGDWIIRGVQGEFYPCKPQIFESTYESADG